VTYPIRAFRFENMAAFYRPLFTCRGRPDTTGW
jgi:hypothetical protein